MPKNTAYDTKRLNQALPTPPSKAVESANSLAFDVSREYLRRRVAVGVAGSVYQYLNDKRLIPVADKAAKVTKNASAVAGFGLSAYPTYRDAVVHDEPKSLALIKGAMVATTVKQGLSKLEAAPLFKAMEASFNDASLRANVIHTTAKALVKAHVITPLASSFMISNALQDEGHSPLTANLATTIGVGAGLGVGLFGAAGVASGAAASATGVFTVPGIAGVAGGSYLIANASDAAHTVAHLTAHGIEEVVSTYPKVTAWVKKQVRSFVEHFEKKEADTCTVENYANEASDFSKTVLAHASNSGVPDNHLLLLGCLLQQEMSAGLETDSPQSSEPTSSDNFREVKEALNAIYNKLASNEELINDTSVSKAQLVLANCQDEAAELIRSWSSNEIDISAYKQCDNIVRLHKDLASLKSQQAPVKEIVACQGKLKDAVMQEEMHRREFDNTLKSAEGVVNLISGASVIFGNKALARQVAIGGGALVSISKNMSALAGLGTAAATVNPVLAVGNIVSSIGSLVSLFDDVGQDATEVIVAHIEQVKAMITNLKAEMHARFDVVDNKLEEIYQRLSERSDMLRHQHKKTQLMVQQVAEDNRRLHQTTQKHLETLQSKIQTLYAMQRDVSVQMALQGIIDPISASINHIETLPRPEQYAEWLAQFQGFFETHAYFTTLTGSRYKGGLPLSSTIPFHQVSAVEGYFQINAFIGYLQQHLPDFKIMPSQPNFVVWAYASLAIIRLVYLVNHSDKGEIRRNEFNLLEKMKTSIDTQNAFYLKLHNPEVITTLVEQYQQALLQTAKSLEISIETIVNRKNNEFKRNYKHLCQERWSAQSAKLAGATITPGTNYSNWFYCWTQTHYGATEYGSTQAIGSARTNYLQTRNEQIAENKKACPMPEYVPEEVLNIGKDGIHAYTFRDNTTNLCIEPEDPQLPPLKGSNFAKALDIGHPYETAEYLGLGEIKYIYRIDNKAINIIARFVMEDVSYDVNEVTLPFDTGVYELSEGVLWAWLGSANVSVRHQTANWIGTTGEAKHWFIDNAYVPVIQPTIAPSPKDCLGSVDEKHLERVEHNIYVSNRTKVRLRVMGEADTLSDAVSNEIRGQIDTNSVLKQALLQLDTSYEMLHCYLMLVSQDEMTSLDPRIAALFGEEAVITHSASIKETLEKPFDRKSDNVFTLAQQLRKTAEHLDAKIISQRLSDKKETQSSLFDAVRAVITDAHAFYQHRVDDTGTYQDIFMANEATGKKFETVAGLLGIFAKNVLKQVKDPEVLAAIAKGAQEDVAAQKIEIPKSTRKAINRAISTQALSTARISFFGQTMNEEKEPLAPYKTSNTLG